MSIWVCLKGKHMIACNDSTKGGEE